MVYISPEFSAPVSQPYRALTKSLGAVQHSTRMAPYRQLVFLFQTVADRGSAIYLTVSIYFCSFHHNLEIYSLITCPENRPQVASRN
jgi:hypothetical protein